MSRIYLSSSYLYCVYQACMTVTNGLRMPMLSNVADYEMSRNGGKQIAGVISAAYSLVDKTIDGVLANTCRYPWPFQSWGIDQREDPEITIEFGRPMGYARQGYHHLQGFGKREFC